MTSTTHTRHTFTGREVLDVAQRRRVDAQRAGGLEDRRAGRDADRGAVDRELHGVDQAVRRRGRDVRRPGRRLERDVVDRHQAAAPSKWTRPSRSGALDRRRRRLAQAADRGVAHRLGEVGEPGELAVHRVERRPAGEPRQQLLLADGPDAARDALAARLVAEERGDPPQRVGEVGGLVEHHDDARAERRAGRSRALERERRVEPVRPDERARRAAEEDRLDRAPARDAARAVEQPAQRLAERDLVDTGRRDVAGQAEQLGAGGALRPDLRVRRGAHAQDQRDVDQRLDVVHRRGLAEQAVLHGERRLVARLGPAALDRLEQRRLLADDVRAGADPELDVEGPAGAHDVVAEQPGRARLADRVLQSLARQRVLAAEVQVPARGADREPLDRHRLEQRERILLEDQPVLERAGLGLVGVAHDVARRGRLRCDGGPLAAGGERRPAATDELRVARPPR